MRRLPSCLDVALAAAEPRVCCLFPRKCRPKFVEADHAKVNFKSLRHPAMCLRSDFIPNDVEMGGDQAKMVLLTGP